MAPSSPARCLPLAHGPCLAFPPPPSSLPAPAALPSPPAAPRWVPLAPSFRPGHSAGSPSTRALPLLCPLPRPCGARPLPLLLPQAAWPPPLAVSPPLGSRGPALAPSDSGSGTPKARAASARVRSHDTGIPGAGWRPRCEGRAPEPGARRAGEGGHEVLASALRAGRAWEKRPGKECGRSVGHVVNIRGILGRVLEIRIVGACRERVGRVWEGA